MTPRSNDFPAVRGSLCVSIDHLAEPAFELLRELARRHGSSRCGVARAVLESIDPRDAEELARRRFGEPKRPPARRSRVSRARAQERVSSVDQRATPCQDDVCRELHAGVIPLGSLHCSYPHCGCKT